MKKWIKKLFSMRFALILLFLLIAACVAGSLITQNDVESYYTSTYSGTLSSVILFMGLDDVFHTWWFFLLTVLLVINLLGCNLTRFPSIIKKESSFSYGNFHQKKILDTYDGDIDVLFDKCGFKNPEKGNHDGKEYVYAVKNKIGLWGPWLTHLGMLIIIVGFALGQIFVQKYSAYGVPGQTKAVEGTNFALTINDFSVELRDDETVEQYTSNVTLTDLTTGESATGTANVNHPVKLLGYKVYQNSTGWAATVSLYYKDELLEQTVVCAGEYVESQSLEGLDIVFRAFYPDYAELDGKGYTLSSSLNNPAYLYMLYYNGEVLGMNVLTDDEVITINDYTITFTDPQKYTLMQLKRDPYTPIVLVGSIVILVALIFAFYVRCSQLCAIKENDKWTIYAYSKKGGLLFEDQVKNVIEQLKK